MDPLHDAEFSVYDQENSSWIQNAFPHGAFITIGQNSFDIVIGREILLRLHFADVCGTCFRVRASGRWTMSISHAPILCAPSADCAQRRCKPVRLMGVSAVAKAEAWHCRARIQAGLPLLQSSGAARVLVLINPKAGNGCAFDVWKLGVPLIDAAGIEHDILTTEHAGHARAVAQGSDVAGASLPPCPLEQYAAVVIASGDGLVSEVLNGLAARGAADGGDRARWLGKMPIGVLPGGSGNGLCASVLSASGEARCAPVEAAFVIAQLRVAPMDLADVVLARSTPEVSARSLAFLSVSWGAIADIDLEADFLRKFCGAKRWELWQGWRLRHPRGYRGQLSYVVEGDDAGQQWVTLSGSWVLLWACNVAMMTSDFSATPDAKLNDGLWHIVIGREGSDNCTEYDCEDRSAQHARVASAMSEGKLQIVRTRAWKLEPSEPLPPHKNTNVQVMDDIKQPTANAITTLGVPTALGEEALQLLRNAGVAVDVQHDAQPKLSCTAEHLRREVLALRAATTVEAAENAMRTVVSLVVGERDAGSNAASGTGWLAVDGERAYHDIISVKVRQGLGTVLCSGENSTDHHHFHPSRL